MLNPYTFWCPLIHRMLLLHFDQLAVLIVYFLPKAKRPFL